MKERYLSVSLASETVEELEKLRVWYGHRSRAEVVRFLASKALKEVTALGELEARADRKRALRK